MCGCLHSLYRGPGLQPRRVPQLGIELAELNWPPFGSQSRTQSTELHQLGPPALTSWKTALVSSSLHYFPYTKVVLLKSVHLASTVLFLVIPLFPSSSISLVTG